MYRYYEFSPGNLMEFIAVVSKKQNLLLWLQLGMATLIWSEYFSVVMSECPSFLKENKTDVISRCKPSHL